MKFKKILSLATCVATVATMLVGCGSNSGTAGSNSTTTSGGKEEKPTELVWYCIGNEPKDLSIVQEKINEYLLEKNSQGLGIIIKKYLWLLIQEKTMI